MMAGLLNAMRMQAMLEGSSRVICRLGIVSSYDPNNYCAKVKIQPEDTETGWLPIASPWVGNGWGMFCPPTPGDMVEVAFQEGDIDAGFVSLRLYNDEDRPVSTPSGEFYLIHKSGSFLKFKNNGDVELNTANDLIASVGANASIDVAGNVDATVGGDATVGVVGSVTATVGGDMAADVTGAVSVSSGTIASVEAATAINLTAPSIGLNGNVTQAGPGGSGGTMTINSPIHTTSTILADQTITSTTDVVGGGKSLKTHVHSGVQSGGSNTGAPV